MAISKKQMPNHFQIELAQDIKNHLEKNRKSLTCEEIAILNQAIQIISKSHSDDDIKSFIVLDLLPILLRICTNTNFIDSFKDFF